MMHVFADYDCLSMTLPDERYTHILTRLTQDGRVLAADLARHFRTSEDTIRRDLRDLRPRDMIDLQSFLWVQGSDEYPD